jgi:hypothetical protein
MKTTARKWQIEARTRPQPEQIGRSERRMRTWGRWRKGMESIILRNIKTKNPTKSANHCKTRSVGNEAPRALA